MSDENFQTGITEMIDVILTLLIIFILSLLK